MKLVRQYFLIFIFIALNYGCASFPAAPLRLIDVQMDGNEIVVRDGERLAVTTWAAKNEKAVLIGLHGMNDYANAYRMAGEWWSENTNITFISYDQRGFGRNKNPGHWPGAAALRSDLIDVIQAVKKQHKDTPIYVVGHSMGGAVALSAAGENDMEIDGLILAAPAVWGGAQMPIFYRLALNMAATLAPAKVLTGESAGRQATDNISVLHEMNADPMVVKKTRIDSVLGISRLMGDAWEASVNTGGKVLFLYGAKDEIIPLKSMQKASTRMCGDVMQRVYEDGWHLLFRDLQSATVFSDIAMWIENSIDDARRRSHRGNVGPAAKLCVSMVAQ